MCTPDDSLINFSARTTNEVQRHIIERGKRNVISRRYHAKDDREAVATRRSDLNGILHVFNVRSVTSVWRLLTFRSQTELGIDTCTTDTDTHQDAANKSTIVPKVIVPDVRRDVSNTNPIVSGIQSGVANTPTVVSDIHHNKLKNREGADGRN